MSEHGIDGVVVSRVEDELALLFPFLFLLHRP